ncbi:GerAB/ArcD/ProY family transporter [Paenibacillus hamazuiensis]|uniref:GerAB/ArcD/ProY family transporter n=1 Tax=Paenibacillus hamazuiensis TaxID=2936508 RepID=UPI002010A20E|nr:GerAB/ArcD/ProY family transporter [Paenibacillus hamazuiensis]
MNRYFYYLVILNMLVNVISYVPQIMTEYRFQGTPAAIVLAVPIGTLLMYAFMKSLTRFPNKTFPEILDLTFSKVITVPFKLFSGGMWYLAGAISMFAIADITLRYINPDSPTWQVTLLYVAIVIYGASRKARTILYTLEMLLLLGLPLVCIIFAKSFLNRAINWDSIIAAGSHINTLPNWVTLAATTYIFSGYLNMSLFGRAFPQPVKTKWIWLLGLLGFGIQLTTYFIPVGFHGLDGVGSYTYPWVSTADSMRIELGFVERVMYIFLLLYAGISAISIMVHWHTAIEFIKSALPRSKQNSPWIKWTIFGLFGAIALIISNYLDQETIFEVGRNWLRIRFAGEMMHVAMTVYAAKRSSYDKKGM